MHAINVLVAKEISFAQKTFILRLLIVQNFLRKNFEFEIELWNARVYRKKILSILIGFDQTLTGYRSLLAIQHENTATFKDFTELNERLKPAISKRSHII